MRIPPDGERKTTFQAFVFAFGIGILERARSEDGFLRLIEGDGAEFFPIADEGVFGHDFVECQFALFLHPIVSVEP